MKINIEGTPLEIIANANNLKQVNDSNIFVNDKKERFILNPLGFMPVEIDASWSLKMKYQGKIDSLKRENVKLNTLLDEMDFELTQIKQFEKMQGKINNLEKLLKECSGRKERLIVQLQFENKIIDFAYHYPNELIPKKEFCEFNDRIREEYKQFKKELNESINNTL
jgi:hypothetical protein